MVKLNTNFGEIKIDLDADKAPITVANFCHMLKVVSTTARFSIALSMAL